MFPLAGFWSKDELLVGSFETKPWLFFVLLAVAVLTAYMTRCVLLTFFGTYRGEAHPHESPRTMTGPLGARGRDARRRIPRSPQLGGVFGDWVFFEHPHEADFVYWVAFVGTLAAAAGIGIGYLLYRERRERDPLMAFPRAWNLLQHRYYIDDFYMRRSCRRSATASPRGWIGRTADPRRGRERSRPARPRRGRWSAGSTARSSTAP